jgi:hypothetical protein
MLIQQLLSPDWTLLSGRQLEAAGDRGQRGQRLKFTQYPALKYKN